MSPSAAADPCTIAGLTFTPVRPELIRARLIILAAVVVPLAVITGGGILAGYRWLWGVLAVVIGVGCWLGWLIPRQVRALGYAETDDELAIRRGIMWRTLTIVPYGRMQYVDVAEGPIARWCHIATVQLHTASAQTDAKLPGVHPDEAARLRERLTARGEVQRAGL
ncbi:MAG: PH domain-containing protein [Bowdeniella nasicola]|nr:PH domain-containing protein [Bowdeniella nasicola]